MPELLSYPSIEVETKYGTLTLTFLDDEFARDYIELEERAHSFYGKTSEPQYRVSGELTINGIGIRVQESYRIGPVFEDCKPTDQIELKYCGSYGYNSRLDGKEWDCQSGYASKLSDLRPIILNACSLNSSLIIEARRVGLANLLIHAMRKVEDAERELLKAIAKQDARRDILSNFLKENGI